MNPSNNDGLFLDHVTRRELRNRLGNAIISIDFVRGKGVTTSQRELVPNNTH